MESMKNNKKEEIFSGKMCAILVAIAMSTTIFNWMVRGVSSIVQISILLQFTGQSLLITKELIILAIMAISSVVSTIVGIRVCKQLYNS